MMAAPALASPNFILVLADDLGWSSLSTSMDRNLPSAHSDYYRTPNLDALAAGGLRFSNGYAAAPVCSPTRYSIQYGKTPARLRRTRSEKRNLVDHEQVSLAQVLKSIDPAYLTAHLGKWHIDADPTALGYDVHDGRTNNRTGGFVDDASQWRGHEVDDPKRVDSLTSRAVAFMQDAKSQERPFFLQLSHYAVHSSIEYSAEAHAAFASADQGAIHTDRGYAAMLFDLDQSIGELMKAYRALGLEDETYIFFLSDNGGMPVIPLEVNRGRPYAQGLNSPLLRGKWDLMEGGLRVPFVVFGPEIDPGGQSDVPVVTYDLLPTIAALADPARAARLPASLDGTSFHDVLSDPRATPSRPTKPLFFHFPHYNRVGMSEPHSAIRRGPYKLVRFPVSDRSLLFDLSKDAGERNDLSTERRDLVVELEAELEAYLREVKAERPEEGSRWVDAGDSGRVRTLFFERYEGQ